MKKLFSLMLLTLIAIALLAPVAFAEEAAKAVSDAKLGYYGMAVLGSGLAIGLAALGTGIGQGIGLRGATEGVARNPGASGKITTTLIIGLAMIESLAIYALVVVLIVLFANPFKL
jgi:F-type H+-transporting ATPase subunit c